MPLVRHHLTAAVLSAAVSAGASAQAKSSQSGAPALAGTALIANQQSASATIVDVASGTATTIPVGTGPHEATISPDGRWGVVTIYGTQQPGNQLAVIDLRARSVTKTIDLGDSRRPHGATFLPGSSSMVVVTSEASRRVVLVDLEAGKPIADIPTNSAGSHMLALTADGSRLYTANIGGGSITEIDLANRAFVRELKVASRTEGIAVTPDGSAVWVGSNDEGTVSVVETKSWSVAAKLEGFGLPYRIGISPDGRLAVICDRQGNRIRIADVAARKVVGEVTGLVSPRGVYIAPDNRTAFVTLGEEEVVAAIDLVDRVVRLKVKVGASPDGVWYR